MDTGYYKEEDLVLKEIDLNKEEDQKFLYTVILFRWKNHDIVNIPHRTPKEVPTYEQHLSYLRNTKYKQIYRICLKEKTIGTIYIDGKDVFSIFILPDLLKNAMKGNKFHRNQKKKLTTMACHQLMKLNPHINTFYVGINVKNTSSLNAAKDLECYPLEIQFGCKNIFANS